MFHCLSLLATASETHWVFSHGIPSTIKVVVPNSQPADYYVLCTIYFPSLIALS